MNYFYRNHADDPELFRHCKSKFTPSLCNGLGRNSPETSNSFKTLAHNITLLCLILGGDQITNFGEKDPQVHLYIIREWPNSPTTNPPPILRNLDNFPRGTFYSTHKRVYTVYREAEVKIIQFRMPYERHHEPIAI